jgi:hypothetical protein
MPRWGQSLKQCWIATEAEGLCTDKKKICDIYRELQSWIATIATEAEGLCTYRKKKIIGEQAKMGLDCTTMYPILQA